MSTGHAITVLFTDLVGSTRLANSLTPDRADEIRRAHFAILRTAINDREGTEVKNLGDGLMVVFERPSAALACAVSMQQDVEAANSLQRSPGASVSPSDVALAIRVGIAVGEATREDNDYFGDPVVTAARLCAVAEAGQILATELSRMLAGRNASQRFGPPRDIELKGIPDPVAVVEVLWEPIKRALSMPLPRLLAAKPAIAFVGRDDVLESLTATFKRVAQDQKLAIAFISGEPGMGKTTLAAQLAQRAFAANAVVLLGRCDEDMGIASQPFAEALGQIVTYADDALIEAHVADYGGALARLVPALRRRVADLTVNTTGDANSDRHVLYSSIVGLLSTLAATAPIVIVLDDLHWADESALVLLRHLAVAAADVPILVVATFRDTEIDQQHPLTDTLATMRRNINVERFALGGLDAEAVADLMARGSGRHIGDSGRELVATLTRESAGNPFFLGELFRHIVDTGMVDVDAGGQWRVVADFEQVQLPGSVRDVIGQRMDRLGDAMRTVLSAAAVVGHEFDLEVLERLVDVDADALIDMLDRAGAASLISESTLPGRYAFTHALTQHALYQDLGATRRARMHQRAAAAIEDVHGPYAPGDSQAMARHLLSGARTEDLARAVAYARLAGEEAMRSLATAEAVRWFETAYGLLDRLDEHSREMRCDVLIELGEARRPTGENFREPLHEAFELAASMGDAERMGRAALARSRGSLSHSGHEDAEWVDELERAIEAQRRSGDRQLAVLLATLAVELSFTDRARRHELAREAEEVAVVAGEQRIELEVLNLIYIPTLEPSLFTQRDAQTIRAQRLAEVVKDPVLSAIAATQRAFFLAEAGDLDECRRVSAETKQLCDRTGVPFLQWRAGLCLTLVEIARGDLAAAEALSTEYLNIGMAAGIPEAMMDFGVQLMLIRSMQGRSAEIADMVLSALSDLDTLPGLRGAVASLYSDLGRDDEARELFSQDAAKRFEHVPIDAMWAPALTSFVDSAFRFRDVGAAQSLYALLEPWGHQMAYSIVAVHGRISHSLALLADVIGDIDARERHFSETLAAYRQNFPSPYWIALCESQWGSTLLDSRLGSDPARGLGLLEDALVAAEQYGFSAIERRARALLESDGAAVSEW